MPHLFAWKEEMLPKVKNKQDGVNAIKGWVAGKKFLLEEQPFQSLPRPSNDIMHFYTDVIMNQDLYKF